MVASLPNGLRWRAEFAECSAVPQGSGAAKGAGSNTVRRSPTSEGHETDPGPGSGQQPGRQPGQTGCGDGMIWLIPMFLILWFLMIRPQQKREKAQKAMVAALNKGDSVVTASGMHGTVVLIADDTVVLKLDQEGKVKVTFDRSSVGRVLNGGGTPGKT